MKDGIVCIKDRRSEDITVMTCTSLDDQNDLLY